LFVFEEIIKTMNYRRLNRNENIIIGIYYIVLKDFVNSYGIVDIYLYMYITTILQNRSKILGISKSLVMCAYCKPVQYKIYMND